MQNAKTATTKTKTIDQVCYPIGRTVFIRTVTHHLVGEVKAIGPQEIVFKTGTVMWVADDGRFTEAMRTGVFSETEVYDIETPFVGRGSIIDGGIFPKTVKIGVNQK